MPDMIVYKTEDGITEVAEERQTRDIQEAMEMVFKPGRRFRRLMGTTDDAQAIQFAIDWCFKKTGRKVKLKVGSYTISVPIRVGHGVSIVGGSKEIE